MKANEFYILYCRYHLKNLKIPYLNIKKNFWINAFLKQSVPELKNKEIPKFNIFSNILVTTFYFYL